MDEFIDRIDAGRQLGQRLLLLSDLVDPIVIGLPRGGVPVAYEVATALDAPLDVLIVRKVGVPYQPELAMGAVGEDGVTVVDEEVLEATNISFQVFTNAVNRERKELERRVTLFRGGNLPTLLLGRTVIIVDDGVATGSTARAACRVARLRGALSVILAVPVIARSTMRLLKGDVDKLESIVVADGPFAVGEWYRNFDQTPDEEVIATLRRAASRGSSA